VSNALQNYDGRVEKAIKKALFPKMADKLRSRLKKY